MIPIRTPWPFRPAGTGVVDCPERGRADERHARPVVRDLGLDGPHRLHAREAAEGRRLVGGRQDGDPVERAPDAVDLAGAEAGERRGERVLGRGDRQEARLRGGPRAGQDAVGPGLGGAASSTTSAQATAAAGSSSSTKNAVGPAVAVAASLATGFTAVRSAADAGHAATRAIVSAEATRESARGILSMSPPQSVCERRKPRRRNTFISGTSGWADDSPAPRGVSRATGVAAARCAHQRKNTSVTRRKTGTRTPPL